MPESSTHPESCGKALQYLSIQINCFEYGEGLVEIRRRGRTDGTWKLSFAGRLLVIFNNLSHSSSASFALQTLCVLISWTRHPDLELMFHSLFGTGSYQGLSVPYGFQPRTIDRHPDLFRSLPCMHDVLRWCSNRPLTKGLGGRRGRSDPLFVEGESNSAMAWTPGLLVAEPDPTSLS